MVSLNSLKIKRSVHRGARPRFCASTAAMPAALLMLGGAVLSGAPSQAACLSTPTDVGTNCAVFTADSDSHVVNDYAVDNLAANRYFQLGFFTTASNPVTITDMAWSRDGNLWSNFATQSLQAGDESNPSYTNVVSLPSPMGDPFHVRYTIPAGSTNPTGTFAEGDWVSSLLISNRDGGFRMQRPLNGGSPVAVLRSKGGNLYAAVQRDHQDAPDAVPGPLALLGVVTGLSAARRLRQKQAHGGRFTVATC